MDVLYPVEFANPNCDDDNGEKNKVCHGAESGWVRGQRFGQNDLGTWASKAYGSFYTTGSIPENKDYSLSTWAGWRKILKSVIYGPNGPVGPSKLTIKLNTSNNIFKIWISMI